MNTTIHEGNFPAHLSGVSDGSVAGTHFYNGATGEEIVLAGVTMQQEGLSTVRVRFAPHYRIVSFVMGPDEMVTLNALSDG